MIQAILSQFAEHDRRIFWTLLFFVVLSLFAYLYFLSVSVFSVVSRRSAEADARTMTARISELESDYAALDKRVDLALAHERGFVDVAVPRYLSAAKGDVALSLRTETPIR